MDGTILVADDDRTIRTVLTQALTRAGCKVRSTGSVNTLWRWVDEGEGDVIVSDVNLPDGDGLEILPSIKRRRPELPVIIISAQNTVLTAIKATESGAFDYLPKPFDLKELLSKVNVALTQSGDVARSNTDQSNTTQDLPLIGSSPAMQDVYRLVARIVNTDLSVVISGESGVGKNHLAQALHDLSARKAEDFITINCATMTPNKIEGMFLGGFEEDDIHAARKASTIFLDEVSELDPECQTQLLEMLRSEKVKSKDYRIVCATSKNLHEYIDDGTFREDLFYRLHVVPIKLPPLRDRVGDIPDLVQHFLHGASLAGLPSRSIAKRGLELMRQSPWLGNVLELENFVKRLVVLSPEDEISSELISNALEEIPTTTPMNLAGGQGKLSTAVEEHIRRYFELHGDQLPPQGLYNRILKEVELPLIALSLAATRGNQIKTSELLGINRNTLRKKIRDLDIQVTRSKKMM